MREIMGGLGETALPRVVEFFCNMVEPARRAGLNMIFVDSIYLRAL